MARNWRPAILSLAGLWILAGCGAGNLATATSTLATAASATPTASPTRSATPEPCSFVWAEQSLPDLSAQVDSVLKGLQADAEGRALAYGESCVPAGGGQSTFGAMETDFYVGVHVRNVTNAAELGGWIRKVMTALSPFSPGVVPGPEEGFVEFLFQAPSTPLTCRVSIREFKQLPPSEAGAAVFHALCPSP